jgi:hypothetical protein
MKERFQNLLTEYGPIALCIHFGLFFTSIFGFWFAIGIGMEVGGDISAAPEWLATSGSARLVTAYVATQLIKPMRLGITVVLTPVVGRLIRRPAAEVQSVSEEPLSVAQEAGKLET